MSHKQSIIILSPYLPALDTTACARKIYDCLRLLKERGYRVYLFAFCSQKDRQRARFIQDYCCQIHLELLLDYKRFPACAKNITRGIELVINSKEAQIIQVENSYMCRYLPARLVIPALLVEHELLSASFRQRSALEMNPINKAVFYLRSKKKTYEERAWFRKFDRIVVFTDEDKSAIEVLYGLRNIEVIPLGVCLDDYPQADNLEKTHDIIFAGNFSHFPNQDAVRYFVREILPLVSKIRQKPSVIIAGDNPGPDIRRLAKGGKDIFVTGYTDDFQENYKRAKVFVAPLRSGTGMRYKILEAMAMGVPVVATSIGASGFRQQESLIVEDTKEGFAKAVARLLADEKERSRLRGRALSLVNSSYRWDTLLDKYESIYCSLL